MWHNGGADFGVPLSNYLGWFFTSWLFFSGFALHLRYAGAPYRLTNRDRLLRGIGILFYAATGLTHLTPSAGQSGHVIDQSGHTWAMADVRESTVATLLFTMTFTSVLAALKLVEKGRSLA